MKCLPPVTSFAVDTSRTIEEESGPYDTLEESNARGWPMGTWEERESGNASVEGDKRNLTGGPT